MEPASTDERWVELRCTLPLIWADPVAEWLLDGRASGVLIEEDGGLVGLAGRVSLITAFPSGTDMESLVEQLRALVGEMASRSGLDEELAIETRSIDPEHLQALLAPSFRAVELDEGLWVAPAEGEGEAGEIPPGAVTIRLIPGLAFGTGRHASTRLAARLCASWFGRRAGRDAARVLDLGTGSGVLAIAACLWGGEPVVGVERDLLALENARRNAALNGFDARIAFVAADLTALVTRPWADLLVANLDRDHFLQGAENLSGWLAPGGAMVASGVLKEHEGVVGSAFERAGLAVVERTSEENWVAWALESR